MSAAKAKRPSLKSAPKAKKRTEKEQQELAEAFVETGKLPNELLKEEPAETSAEPVGRASNDDDLAPVTNVVTLEVVMPEKPELAKITTSIEVVILNDLTRLTSTLKIAGELAPSNNDLINEACAIMLEEISVAESGKVVAVGRAEQWLHEASNRHDERAGRRGYYYHSKGTTKEEDQPVKNRTLRLNESLLDELEKLEARLKLFWDESAPGRGDMINEATREMLVCYNTSKRKDKEKWELGQEWLKRSRIRYNALKARPSQVK